MLIKVGISATIHAILRYPFDFFLVFGIKLRARLFSYLRPKPLYRPLGHNELRLLSLHAPLTTRNDELICCTMHHESLEHTPEYKAWKEYADPKLRLQHKRKAWYAHATKQEKDGLLYPWRFPWGDYAALSYCWGAGLRSHQMIVNGQIFAVTETLEAALRSIRDDMGELDGKIRIWADALCINQDDIAERGKEVRRMRKIFGNSAGVLVHLGPEGNNSTQGMLLIDRMCQNIRGGFDLPGHLLQAAIDLKNGNPVPDQEGLIAVFNLLCRPYWSRLWIIQELAMGGDHLGVGCGNKGMDLAEVRQILKFIVLNEESFSALIPHELLASNFEAYRSVIQILWSTTRLRELAFAPSDRDFTFSEDCYPILRLAQYASATDPRDKVYGVMSLLPAKLALRVDRQDENYTLATREVFMNFTRAIIDLTDDLDIIYCASLQQKEISKLDLPSWSPDWTLQPGRSVGTGSQQEWFFGEDKRYDTFYESYNLPSAWSRDPSRSDMGCRAPQIRFSHDGRLLFCHGIEIANITGICSETATLTLVSKDPGLMIQPEAIESPYGNEEETRQALIRTLLLDASGMFSANSIVFKLPWFGTESDPYGKDGNEIIQGMVDAGWNRRCFGSGLMTFNYFRHRMGHFLVGNRPFRDYFVKHVTPCPQDASVLEFTIVISNLVGRRLFITSTGHVGLAPATILPSDKVYVLMGCSMPFVLRPNGSGRHYEVVGECFVDGFMKGEAVTALDARKYQLQEIILC